MPGNPDGGGAKDYGSPTAANVAVQDVLWVLAVGIMKNSTLPEDGALHRRQNGLQANLGAAWALALQNFILEIPEQRIYNVWAFPMTLEHIKDILGAQVLCGDQLMTRAIESCFACDLVSEMLLYLNPGSLLITSLMSAHILHTAQVMDASAVVFVGGKRPDAGIIKTAELNGIPLLSTKHLMFESCGLIFANGIRGDRIKWGA